MNEEINRYDYVQVTEGGVTYRAIVYDIVEGGYTVQSKKYGMKFALSMNVRKE